MNVQDLDDLLIMLTEAIEAKNLNKKDTRLVLKSLREALL